MKKIKLTTSAKKFNSKQIQDALFTLAIFAIMIIIISNPKRFTAGTISGLKLFFYSVLPGLFPFMLLTKLLTEIGFLFKITSKFNNFTRKFFGTTGVSMYIFCMSILSGYPIGAKLISDLYSKQLITTTDAKKMSIFCTTSGPIFVIGAVGAGMFKSLKIGLILYFSHIISSVLIGILYNVLTIKKTSEPPCINQSLLLLNKNNNYTLSNVVSETINSLFVVGAYITIFFLISEILDALKIISFIVNLISKPLTIANISTNTTKGLVYGIIEVTRGSKVLSATVSHSSIAICSGIISFSGLSIIMQSMAFLKNAKIKTHSFVFAKCVHCVVSIFICYLLLFFI